MIDNIPENFQNQPNNGFSIHTWKDDINDKELLHLMKILNFIFEETISDVTEIIKKINTLTNNQNYDYSTIDLESIKTS